MKRTTLSFWFETYSLHVCLMVGIPMCPNCAHLLHRFYTLFVSRRFHTEISEERWKEVTPVMSVVSWLLLLYLFLSSFFLFGDTPLSINILYEDHIRADIFKQLISVKPTKSLDIKIWYITSVFNWSIYFTILSMIGRSNMSKTWHDITMHGILLVMLVYL